MGARIRVLIADDHAVLRAGLRVLLGMQRDMEVAGEAADGEQAIRMVAQLQPDVVLMDIAMPGGGGIEAIQAARRRAPDTAILVLTMHEDEAYLRRALVAGACGYVVKSAADTELVAAIRAVARGEMYVDPALAQALVQRAFEEPTLEAVPSDSDDRLLSPREEEVLKLIAAGYTGQQVAERLYISPKTAETHKARGMEKLGLGNRAALVRYAMARHWLDDLPPEEG